MKIIFTPLIALLLCTLPISSFAQGNLTPAGAPTPTMKTLQQIEPRTPISTSGFTISQPGSYYVTTNLFAASGFGIRVNSDDVTLDLGGWTLTGSPGTTEGVVCQFTMTNITVRNGTVRGFNNGVHLALVSGAKVESVTAVGNSTRGIYTGFGSAIIDCAAIRNGNSGIQSLVGGTIRSCRSYENGANGYFIAANNSVRDSLSASNAFDGFNVGPGSSLHGCVAHDNIQVGIRTDANVSLNDCTARNNLLTGIVTGRGSSIKDTASVGNNGSGFQTDGASRLLQVNSHSNNANGISLIGDGVMIEKSMVCNNTSYGIFFNSSSHVISDCLIASNCVTGTTTAGILVGGTRNHIENNTLIRNGPYGIFNGFIGGTTNNLVIRNHASGHTTANISMGSGNHLTTATGPNVTTNLNPYVNFSLP